MQTVNNLYAYNTVYLPFLYFCGFVVGYYEERSHEPYGSLILSVGCSWGRGVGGGMRPKILILLSKSLRGWKGRIRQKNALDMAMKDAWNFLSCRKKKICWEMQNSTPNLRIIFRFSHMLTYAFFCPKFNISKIAHNFIFHKIFQIYF